jgi:hypothetical protein
VVKEAADVLLFGALLSVGLSCARLAAVHISYSYSATGYLQLLSSQPRNGEPIPMSRITTITFNLAALGIQRPLSMSSPR